MKRDKIRKLIALSILLTSFIVILILFSKKTKINVKEDTTLSEGQSELHLVQTDGKKEIFELYAKRHYPDKLGRFHLNGDIKIKIFGKAEGKDIVVKGDSGIYEKDMTFVAINNSEVSVEDLKIKSKELIYTLEGTIKSYSPSKFEHKYGNGEADNFIYDLNKKTITAHNFKGDFKKEENFNLSADKTTLSYNENSILMEGNCLIKSEKYDLKSEKVYFIFSEGKIVYFIGDGNPEIIYSGKEEGKGVAEILGREGNKVLRCERFEVKREENHFNIKVENRCKLEFPAKIKGEIGSLGAQLINIVYERGKGLKEAKAEGNFFFIDSDLRMEAKNTYGKPNEERKEWEIIKGEGEVKYQGNVSFECGNFSKNKNIILLERKRPSVKRNEEMVFADRIEYDSEKKIMKGTGNVRAFLGQKVFSASVPFFKNERKIFARGESIFWDENEEIINLKGNASLEQGEQFLKSQDLLFERKKESFSTNKQTQFLFLSKDETISGICNSAKYSKEKNLMVLSGNSKLSTKEYSIKGGLIKIGFDKEGELNFIEGESGVEFSSKEIEGEGDKFYLDLKNKKAIFDGNPSIKDEKRGKMRGRKILIDLETKEVKIEGNISEVEIKENG